MCRSEQPCLCCSFFLFYKLNSSVMHRCETNLGKLKNKKKEHGRKSPAAREIRKEKKKCSSVRGLFEIERKNEGNYLRTEKKIPKEK